MTRESCPTPSCQDGEAIVEPVSYLLQTERSCAGRGKFYGERNTV